MNTHQSFFNRFGMLVFIKGMLLSVLCLLAATQVQAAGYSIQCADVNDPQTCELVGQGAPGEATASLVQDLFEAIQLSVGTENVCTLQNNDTQAVCNLSSNSREEILRLFCERTSDNQGDGIRCGLLGDTGEGQGPIYDLLEISCLKGVDSNAGSCTFDSDTTAIEERLRSLGMPGHVSSFAGNLLLGCALRSGTDAFQRDCDNFIYALAQGEGQRIANLLEVINPQNVDFAMDATIRTVGIRLSHISNRLRRLRRGVQGTDVSAIQFFDGQQWLSGGQMVAANNDTMTDVSPTDEFSRLGFFIDGSIVSASQDATQVENDADLDSQMFTAGVDYRITNSLIGGVAFSVATSNADYGENRGELDDQGYLLLAYGTYYSGAWYFDASIGLGGNDYEQTRFLRCSVSQCGQLINQDADADFSGEQTAVTVGGGYDFSFGAFSVTPYAQIASIKLDIDGYRETMSDPNGPGSGYALDIDDQSRDSLTFSLGTQVSYVFSQNWGIFIPHFDIQLYKENEDDENLVSGRFVGNVGVDNNFELATNEIDTSYYIVGIGGLFQLQNGSSGFIDIKSMQGNDDIDETQFTAGWRWEL